MPSYKTPGVYIEEISTLPPSVAVVSTAVPAFIGYTAKKPEDRQDDDLSSKAVRISSLLEYVELFGEAAAQIMKIEAKKLKIDQTTSIEIGWSGMRPTIPDFLLYHSIQLYFANGGGPCYIYSLGEYPYKKNRDGSEETNLIIPNPDDFTAAITDLESVDEPTLLVFPDSVLLTDEKHGNVIDAALVSCQKTQNRFTIADIREAIPDKTDTPDKVKSNARTHIKSEFLMHGSLYFPYVETLIPFAYSDENVILVKYEEPTTTNAAPTDKELSDIVDTDTEVYTAVKSFLSMANVTLPVSGAIAGVYCQVDRTRGVWKAPANVGLALVSGPTVKITDDLQDDLNIDPATGKSVNVIRSFTGRGTLVWGARTLADNDNEWKYISARRFANFVEDSIGKSIISFAFHPNDANTWTRVRAMVENFLTTLWRDGALMGTKPEHAFHVSIGLGKTMTADDILNGRMILVVHLAIVRPAEFTILKFIQKMQES
ncbi:MAG: phage tail sheath C-terminal domain-containing protein [Halopseudomonas aestusnigri]